MHLLVDAQPLQIASSSRRGIGRYARNLLREITKVPGVRVEMVFNAALPAPDEGDLRLAPAIWWEPLLPLGPASDDANARYLGEWLTARADDALLLPGTFEWDTVVPKFGAVRPPLVAAVVYDLIPLQFHQYYLRNAGIREFYGSRLRRLADCDLALAISEATRRDTIRLLRWPDDRVVAILGAAEPLPASAPTAERTQLVLRGLQIDRPFVLYVGGYDRRKNVIGAIAGFAALPATVKAVYQLVIVCALDARQRRTLERVAARYGVPHDVRLTGYVDDEALDILYRACRMTIFPSHYEGLGLPLLEALARGAPVVASRTSAIPEFAGPGAHLIDPSSPPSLAAAIEAMLAEPYEAREQERRQFASTFQWPAIAARAAAALRAASRPAPSASDGRPRIAWVSPLPPTPSGIADYSAELLARMPAGLNIVLVISPEATLEPVLAQRYAVLRPDEALARHERTPFDLFVYHVGNSDLHLYMLEMMRRCAGLTVLHDVYLGGLALRASRLGAWIGSLSDALEAEGFTVLSDSVQRGEADHRQIAETATLNHPLLVRSDAVVVHSGWSWSRVRVAASVPVLRIPLGVPAAPVQMPHEARRALGLDEEAFIIATLGEVTDAKRLDRLIQAVGQLPRRILERTELLVVGHADDAARTRYHEQARQLGVGGLRFLGRVRLGELGTYGAAAAACVQLRYPPRGETSAALLRALAAGSACIVTNAGSLAEIPSSAALHVEPDDREVEQLCAALVRLHDDQELSRSLRTGAVAFVQHEHSIDAAVSRYVAAINLTIARRTRRDGDWADAALYAIERASQGPLDDRVFERWAETHVAAVTAQQRRD